MDRERISLLINFDDEGDTSTGYVGVSGTQDKEIINGSVFWWYVCNCKDTGGKKNPFHNDENSVMDPQFHGNWMDLKDISEDDILHETETNAGPYEIDGSEYIDGRRVTFADAVDHEFGPDDTCTLVAKGKTTDYVDKSDDMSWYGYDGVMEFDVMLGVENSYEEFKDLYEEYFVNRPARDIIQAYFDKHLGRRFQDEIENEIEYIDEYGRDEMILDHYFNEDDPTYDPYKDEEVIEKAAEEWAEEQLWENNEDVTDDFLQDIRYWMELIIRTYPSWCQKVVRQ